MTTLFTLTLFYLDYHIVYLLVYNILHFQNNARTILKKVKLFLGK
jgi:hypothetical protein